MKNKKKHFWNKSNQLNQLTIEELDLEIIRFERFERRYRTKLSAIERDRRKEYERGIGKANQEKKVHNSENHST